MGISINSDTTSSGPLTGQTFVFTGTLTHTTREEAKQKVIALGGKVASTIGDQVTHLVSGEKSGSKLTKAKKLGITILTPDEFMGKINK